MIRPLTSFLIATALCTVAISFLSAEKKETRTGLFRVELEKGSFYSCYVPKLNNPKDKYGVILALHGAGGSPDHLVNGFIAKKVSKQSILDSMGWIGIFPKSLKETWYFEETTPSDALEDVLQKYNVDRSRIHISGYSAGGFLAAYMAMQQPDTFRSATVFAAFLSRVEQSVVKKNISKPIYTIVGETDHNRAGGEQAHKATVELGARWNRLFVYSGYGHMFPFENTFERLKPWYDAIESGFDYPAEIDAAHKLVETDIAASVAAVAKIEQKPHEEQFDIELSKLRHDIDAAGRKQAESIVAEANESAKYKDAIEKLKELEKILKSYPCAKDIAKMRASLEKK